MREDSLLHSSIWAGAPLLSAGGDYSHMPELGQEGLPVLRHLVEAVLLRQILQVVSPIRCAGASCRLHWASRLGGSYHQAPPLDADCIPLSSDENGSAGPQLRVSFSADSHPHPSASPDAEASSSRPKSGSSYLQAAEWQPAEPPAHCLRHSSSRQEAPLSP